MSNVSDDSFMFFNNSLVVNPTFIPDGKIQLQYHILKYHRTREAQSKGVIKFVRISSNEKPANIATKICASNTWFPLMKPLLFWRGMEFLREQVVSKGSGNM